MLTGLPGFELSCLLLNPFLLKSTDVRLLTPLVAGLEELLSSFFEDTEDSVVLELSDSLLCSVAKRKRTYIYQAQLQLVIVVIRKDVLSRSVYKFVFV